MDNNTVSMIACELGEHPLEDEWLCEACKRKKEQQEELENTLP